MVRALVLEHGGMLVDTLVAQRASLNRPSYRKWASDYIEQGSGILFSSRAILIFMTMTKEYGNKTFLVKVQQQQHHFDV